MKPYSHKSYYSLKKSYLNIFLKIFSSYLMVMDIPSITANLNALNYSLFFSIMVYVIKRAEIMWKY